VDRKHVLSYSIGAIGLLVIVVFLLRLSATGGYPGTVFLQSGLLYDRVCYVGSYEMVVCPYTALPYETIMAMLAVLLVFLILIERAKIGR
jgi:hypothetical protein